MDPSAEDLLSSSPHGANVHELAVAEAIVAAVRKAAAPQLPLHVRAVGVKVGELSDIVPDALSFAFEMITRDTELAHVTLRIEQTPITACCNNCHSIFRVEDFVFICPHCGSADTTTRTGEELHVVYVEVDDGPVDDTTPGSTS